LFFVTVTTFGTVVYLVSGGCQYSFAEVGRLDIDDLQVFVLVKVTGFSVVYVKSFVKVFVWRARMSTGASGCSGQVRSWTDPRHIDLLEPVRNLGPRALLTTVT